LTACNVKCLSIVIPVHNQCGYTRACLASLAKHPPDVSFEVLVVDDYSTDDTPLFLAEAARKDSRIRTIRADSVSGFARSCNRGALSATGSYLLFLNNDTELQPGWFNPLFTILEKNPHIGIVGPKLTFPDGSIQHCGKIWKDIGGHLSQPHHIYYRAPGDAPFVNESREYQMLTGACIMVRRGEFLSIGPFDETYENGWEDDDLCYAYRAAGKRSWYCAESTVIHYESKSLNEKIAEAQERLYSHRKAKSNGSEKNDDARIELRLISDIEQKLLGVRERFLRNRSRFLQKWESSIVRDDYLYYKKDGIPFVSIIIPVFNKVDFTRKCLEALRTTTPEGSYELIIVDNGSSDGTHTFLDTLPLPSRIISNSDNLGFARACNQGAQEAHGEYLLFLNNDTEPHPGWLDALVEAARRHSAGVVGCKLLYPDGRVQHAGIALIDGIPDHPNRFAPSDSPAVNSIRELDIVTGACILINRELFIALKGFDEIYRNGVEDVDFCLRVREAGYPVIYQPRAEVIHHEGTSEGRFDNVRGNLEIFFSRWQGRFDTQGRFIPSSTTKTIIAQSSFLTPPAPASIIWQGSQFVCHSLALVNRELCLQLIERNYELSIIPYEPDQFGAETDSRFTKLAAATGKTLSQPADIVVRHQWPPDFSPPPQGYWVMIQPWEFGSLPTDWIEPMRSQLDEIWVPTSYVRDCYIQSGVPADRVQVVANGVDTCRFSPKVAPLSLTTGKRFRFLFVGGTIPRKGIDLLLTAYGRAFSRSDDVCLVIKDMGGNSFYRGQTAAEMIERFKRQPNAPEIEYIDCILSPDELAGLYTACHCLVHPYRGEGFGLPIAEAMACGLATIVTGYGAALDFCTRDTTWFIPACIGKLPEKRIGDMATVDHPWLAEPDLEELRTAMRHAASHPAEALSRGERAASHIHANFSWSSAADTMEHRISVLMQKPVRRLQTIQNTVVPGTLSIILRATTNRETAQSCIESVRRHTSIPYELTVVSSFLREDEINEWLRDKMPTSPLAFRLLDNDNHVEACNEGIRTAQGEYLCLLHADLVLTPSWIAGLLECLERVPACGIAGPMSNGMSGIQMVCDTSYADLSELDEFAARFRERHRFQRIPSRHISGRCMLFRRELVASIGLLDENLDLERSEDEDFCLRAALAGYRNVIAGDVFIHHVGSASFKGNNFDYVATLADNGRLFREKWSKPVTDENEGKKIITLKTLEKAEVFFHRAEYNSLIETILQEGIRHIPDEKRFYYALAEYFLDLGRHKDAFDTLGELSDVGDDEDFFVLRGQALAGMKRYQEALAQGQEALRINRRSAPALHLLGTIAAALGQNEQAAHCRRQAVGLAPGYGEPYTALGIHELNNNNHKTALDLLERGFLLSPLTGETGYRYHTAASVAGEFERAELLFREMHRIYPQHRSIHFLLIDLLIRQEKIEEALSNIEDACVIFGVTEELLAAGLELRRSIGPITIPKEKLDSGTGVSLCMIMKNEQENLPRCLKSIKPVVDEIIITDTGSTDSSRGIAQLFGARLYEFPWNGDFSTARNVSLEHATGKWILVIDADEVLSELDYRRFKDLVAGAPHGGAAYDIVTRNYMFNINLEKWRPNDGRYPNDEAGAGWTPSNKVRLFPNLPDIRFENPVHEMVDLSIAAKDIPILPTDIPVHHYGYLDKSRQKRKGEEYYLLGRKKLEQSGGNDFRALCELAVQAGGIGRYQEAVELWQRVLAINPSYPLALFNLGYALLQMGRFEESRTASAKAMELNPELFEAVNNFAICEICIGSTEEAIRVLESSLKKRPDDANTLVMLSVAQLCSGEIQSGRGIFQRLTESGVEYAEFINEATKKLFEAGKAEYARTLLETAILLRSGNEETGRLLREFGETQ
jgi:GT2 family glycosyltransferase/glycosyltransferase involved in cell wall biosynthesis/Flp pilus assembly protein TadD